MLCSNSVPTELIGCVYDAAADATLWKPALAKIAQTFEAESAALVIHELRPNLHTLAASWSLDPEGARLYENHFGSVDIWAERAQSRHDIKVVTSETLCPAHELARTEFYNDFLFAQDIAHGLFGFVVREPSRRLGSLSLYRGLSSKEFQTSDVETLDPLMPHIRRAYTLHTRISELKEHAEGIEAAINMLTTGVVFIGAKGQIILMNSKAEELLRKRDGLFLVQAKISAAVHLEAIRLRALISSAANLSGDNGVSIGGTVLVSRNVGRPLSVTVAPLRTARLGVGHQAAAVLFISDPDQKIEVPIDVLTRCYGLTPAEARLTGTLLEGCSLKDAADLCGVTRNTAKSQLKSIFLKTQVRRQGELIRLLLTACAPLRNSR